MRQEEDEFGDREDPESDSDMDDFNERAKSSTLGFTDKRGYFNPKSPNITSKHASSNNFPDEGM